MITEGTDKKFADYISTSDEKWEYGNGVLYNMCKDNPLHNDEHVQTGNGQGIQGCRKGPTG